jgi:hypothetical protein
MARSRIHDLVRGGVTGAQWLEGLTPGTLAYQQAEERFLTGEVGSLAQELLAHQDDAEQVEAMKQEQKPRQRPRYRG